MVLHIYLWVLENRKSRRKREYSCNVNIKDLRTEPESITTKYLREVLYRNDTCVSDVSYVLSRFSHGIQKSRTVESVVPGDRSKLQGQVTNITPSHMPRLLVIHRRRKRTLGSPQMVKQDYLCWVLLDLPSLRILIHTLSSHSSKVRKTQVR